MKPFPSDPFLAAYLTAAFWTFDDNAPGGCDYRDTGRAEELFQRLTKASLQRAVNDCKAFEDRAREFLLSWSHVNPNYGAENAGHDFWLTRNGHGSGFWDRGLDDVGDRLTEVAKSFGECNLIASRGHLYLK